MNLRRIGAALLFVLGLAVTLQNLYIALFAAREWKFRLYYLLLAAATAFFTAGARYVWKKSR
ncbi:MAG: hypothetical protein GXO27_05865 [Chlorobi bacterium]|nr:hypothetical protein [Chlorobiota bacterium]